MLKCYIHYIEVHWSCMLCMICKHVISIPHTQVRNSSLPLQYVVSFIVARLLYLRCKKVQGSISGRKIKRNTSSAVWNTERKYNSTPHSFLHPPYHIAQLILVLLMRLLGSFVILYRSAFVCLTLSEVGEVRGILSATTVNSLVNSWAMTGTDSDFTAAWVITMHTRSTIMTMILKLVNLCMAGLLWMNLYENSQGRCTETPPGVARQQERLQMHESFCSQPKA